MNGLQLYDNGSFQEAIPLFTQEISAHPSNKLAVLLRGVSYLATDNIKPAQSDFEVLRSEKHIMFGEQATWYLALSYLHEGDTRQTKTYLTELSGSRFSKQANNLLEKLE
jgi:hypothetical protein